jgi:hypothetical protein
MNDEPSPPLLYDFDRTAHELGGLSTRQVYRLVDQGVITKVRIGARSFIVAASVHAYVAKLEAAGQ